MHVISKLNEAAIGNRVESEKLISSFFDCLLLCFFIVFLFLFGSCGYFFGFIRFRRLRFLNNIFGQIDECVHGSPGIFGIIIFLLIVI
jgi:hypothetical protein